ncbi:GMC oxidoreductase [Stipitochalara longipes BDJ]|nr:GMC oxidoreductase [Stipitochalara longipes BDJ]
MRLNHSSDTYSTDGLSDTYDFIIIGGGTAGLVVAARLTEDPKVRVLVLEAGPNKHNDPNILTPGLASVMLDNPDYDWEFLTAPQEALNGRQVAFSRGKVLGGSSALYQYQLVYSSPSTFRAWVALGNPGWDFESMLPYLRKFHTHATPLASDTIKEIEPISFQDTAVESSSGPIQTSYSPIGDKIMKELGYKGEKLGGFAVPNGIDPKTKSRSYAATAFYSSEIASRSNLRVVTEAMVQRVVFRKEGTEIVASGIEFISKSAQTHTIIAKKEVILSAGALQSPQLLELSGIGDAKLLSQHGIEVMVDNPNVGENLQDHALVPVSFEAAEGVSTAESFLRDPELQKTVLQMYEKDRSGPLGGFFVSAAQAKLPSVFEPSGSFFLPDLMNKISSGKEKRTELDEITMDIFNQEDGATAMHQMAKLQFNIAHHPKITKMMTPTTPGEFFTLLVSLNHPFSRGNVHITSSSVSTYPRIDPKYFSHPMDIEITARHVQLLTKLLSIPPFSKFFKQGGKRIPSHAFSENEGKEISLEDAKKLTREQMISNYHPTGSCMMAPREKGGVVDERLRVHGVKGLRVVDASIFPVVPRGNIITNVYATAEKAADLIKEDWRGR